MPIYSYKCDECDHQFEIKQRIVEDSLTKCPECQKEKLRRLINFVPGISFKGSGFYINDSKKELKSSANSDNNKVKTSDTKDANNSNSKKGKVSSGKDKKTSKKDTKTNKKIK